jgi:hypothetical protein
MRSRGLDRKRRPQPPGFETYNILPSIYVRAQRAHGRIALHRASEIREYGVGKSRESQWRRRTSRSSISALSYTYSVRINGSERCYSRSGSPSATEPPELLRHICLGRAPRLGGRAVTLKRFPSCIQIQFEVTSPGRVDRVPELHVVFGHERGGDLRIDV